MADLNANNIKEENPVVVPEGTGDSTSTDSILDLTASTADLQKELDLQFKEREERRKEIEDELETETKRQKTLREKATKFISTRPSREDELQKELASLGVKEDIEQVRSLITEVGSLRSQLNKIDEAKAQAIEGLAGQGRGIPISIIRGQQAKTERQFNIRRAAVAAELGAKAATAEALRGNAQFAFKLAQDTVNAIVFDFEQKAKDFEDLFEFNQDIIDSLSKEQKSILETQRDDAKDELERRREEAETVSKLMIDNPNAGVLPTDSITTASEKVAKAGGSIAARQETRLGEDGGTVFTSTQENKGASRAGMTIGEFDQLSSDVKNFFVNAPTKSVSAVKESIAGVKDGSLDVEKEKEEIDESNLIDAVKTYVKEQLDIAATAPTAVKKPGFFANTWNAIKSAFK
jgi:hypothetical protein